MGDAGRGLGASELVGRIVVETMSLGHFPTVLRNCSYSFMCDLLKNSTRKDGNALASRSPHGDWLFISAFSSEFEIRSFTTEAMK